MYSHEQRSDHLTKLTDSIRMPTYLPVEPFSYEDYNGWSYRLSVAVDVTAVYCVVIICGT